MKRRLIIQSFLASTILIAQPLVAQPLVARKEIPLKLWQLFDKITDFIQTNSTHKVTVLSVDSLMQRTFGFTAYLKYHGYECLEHHTIPISEVNQLSFLQTPQKRASLARVLASGVRLTPENIYTLT